jgi:hypothetical protein
LIALWLQKLRKWKLNQIFLNTFAKPSMKIEGFAFLIIMEEQNENQINIELSEEIAEGTYANLAVITHSSSEFVLDFIRVMPGVPKAKVQSRIILTPEHAKRLLVALEDNIEKFETANGRVKLQNGPTGFPMNFGGTMGQA